MTTSTPRAGSVRPRRLLAVAAGVALVAVLLNTTGLPHARAAMTAAVRVAPLTGDTSTAEPAQSSATAVFAGGCFWGVQSVFQHTRGVLQALSGYAGGTRETAAYEQVGSGLTGHAESVQVTYDPRQITYAQLLQIYFSVAHDPTQLNRQGPDHGSQYRSAVFYANPWQKQTVERYIAQLNASHAFAAPIVTRVEPLSGFYAAEAYHQDYATLHPDSGYIATYDAPKIADLKALFADRYRDTPVLVGRAGAIRTP